MVHIRRMVIEILTKDIARGSLGCSMGCSMRYGLQYPIR
jgi:hypothetical protein